MPEVELVRSESCWPVCVASGTCGCLIALFMVISLANFFCLLQAELADATLNGVVEVYHALVVATIQLAGLD
jgi:hypothetical protein